ncbi:hypothetical protein AB6A40_006424 [Gnathostoma spinigerum]|uniref:Ankyrin repeat domain-containing protein n=1 Tax=Gnathostoma spinigerum TaxID=75299 RepID=A0ABD6EIB9_9BILA
MTKEDYIRREYPLHWAVFRKDFEELKELLEDNLDDTELNKLDVRGRTPLMLAVTLGHLDCARALLEKGAEANTQNAGMWSLVHEATSVGDPELLRLVLQHRDYQRAVRTSQAIEKLLQLLNRTDDFYAEMSWEFTSWLPFVSRMCPSDTYKIYKRGSDVRIDTSLVGVDSSTNWKRGSQSFIFRLSPENRAQFVILDHDKRTAAVQNVNTGNEASLDDYEPTEEAVYSRMSSPIDTTYVDIDKIGFERAKPGGIWSWITSSNKTEEVDGYECKVFNASNVEIVTKTRTEHLLEEEKQRLKEESNNNPLYNVLKLIEKRQDCSRETVRTGSDIYCGLTPSQYLDKEYDMKDRDIGLPKEIVRRSNSFKATLWMCDPYPLNLQDQVLPIIDLMAVNNAHFARLKNFVQLQLPAGFPAKIEIPLFHVVSARITFGNINEPGPFVTPGSQNCTVTVGPEAFQVPSYYRILTDQQFLIMDTGSRSAVYEQANNRIPARSFIPSDELYLQYALEQSMREAARSAVNHSSVVDNASATVVESDNLDPELMLAISESLRCMREAAVNNEGEGSAQRTLSADALEDDLARVLRLSEEEAEARQLEQQRQDEELERVLKISLIEK